jgi:hypothetical protein
MRFIVASTLMALAALGAQHTARAQGGPPMITDDPGTPGDGHWEINVAATGRHGSHGSESELPLLDINYGVGDRIQLKYEVPWVVQHEDGSSRSGLGNSLLGIKWRFYDVGEDDWQLSMYPQVELRNPRSHSARRGLAEDGTAVLLPVQVQRTFEHFGVNVEVGRELRSRSDDEWFGGVVIGHEWHEGLEGMAELHMEASQSLDRSALAVNLGMRIGVTDSGTLLVSIGHEIRNALEERASRLGYIGWQVIL